MAAAVAANAIDGECTVRGWQAVPSSYPEFADDLAGVTAAPMTDDPAARIVAIDGPSGSGKSTVARGVACKLDLPVLDTGAMYRAIDARRDRSRRRSLRRRARVGGSRAAHDRSSRSGVTTIGGRDVSAEIRGPEVTAAVSIVVRASRGPFGSCRAPAGVGRCARRWCGRRTRHRDSRVPACAGEGVPHRQRRRARPAPPARRSRVRPRRPGRHGESRVDSEGMRSIAAGPRRRCGRADDAVLDRHDRAGSRRDRRRARAAAAHGAGVA